jgi:hypothetical protein
MRGKARTLSATTHSAYPETIVGKESLYERRPRIHP